MSALSPVERRERRERRRRQELIRWGIRIGLALLIFLFGVALGQALDGHARADAPHPDLGRPRLDRDSVGRFRKERELLMCKEAAYLGRFAV